MPRDAFPVQQGILDNDSKNRENVRSERLGSNASSTSEAYDLPNGLTDAPQVADYLRISKTSYKLIEQQKITAIRIGKLLRFRKDKLNETLRAMGNGI